MRLRRVARVLSKVRGAGGCGCAVDCGQEGEVAAGVVHLAAAEGDRMTVMIPPGTRVGHPADEHLLRPSVLAAVAVDAAVVCRASSHLRRETRRTARRLTGDGIAGRTTTVFATGIAGYCHGPLIHEILRVVVDLPLAAVIGVDARTSGEAGIVFAEAIVVEVEVKFPIWTPHDLAAQAAVAVVSAIGLPAVDDPGFDLQLVCHEVLDTDAVEEPGCVGRHIRRLVGPVVEVVVTEEADVGNEDAGVHVQAVTYIPVIAAPRLREVLVGVFQIPLATVVAGVVAHGGLREQAIHGQDAAARVLDPDVAAEAGLLKLEFFRAVHFGRAHHGVVLGMVVIEDVVGVEANFRSEVLGAHWAVVVVAAVVRPCPVREGPRSGFGGGFRRDLRRWRCSGSRWRSCCLTYSERCVARIVAAFRIPQRIRILFSGC